MKRTLPWKPLLCLLFLLSTGCDRAEKQKIAAQLQQDKEAISSVVKKSYHALCGLSLSPAQIRTIALRKCSKYLRLL
ncbi:MULTISPECIES: hypothetical protein [unclassified Escherichia]|uniref:hypothetical protein n=1 Tax=unclassified Escherichia TaxID=2608889 RepID=UPI001F0F56F2|nr:MULTISPECIES: hypothetical protein [unclassified Escherichia]